MARLPKPDLEHFLRVTHGLWEEMRGQSIFLTGGTGFVGSWLLETLLAADDAHSLGVRIAVLTRDPSLFRRMEPHLALHPSVEVLGGDLADFELHGERFTYVLHCAVNRAIEPDAQRPLGAFDSEMRATRCILDLARECRATRFLFTSSGAVYGRQPTWLERVPEEHTAAPATMESGSWYGHAKRTSEFMVSTYSRACGFDAVVARLFAFAGPRLPLDANYAVGNFVRDALQGGPVRVTGDGTPLRSYLYAADMAAWLWTLAVRGRAGVPYNVGSPNAVSIAELARVVVDVLAPGVPIEIALPAVPGMAPLRYLPDTSRAAVELGLHVEVPLEESIRRMAAWYRERVPK